MANYTTTITNEGAALLASVIANQGTLTFNEFRFSENNYTGQESTLTEGTFLGVFITASAAASVIDSTTIKASAQFDNSTITGNHDLYSIGIIGTDGNTTALIAVCTTTDPDVIREPLTGTSTYAFNVNLTVSDTSQITVVGTTAAVIYDIDVVDNLTSPATNKPLSANQGRLIDSALGGRNIVINWDFTHPINETGATSGTFAPVREILGKWETDYSGDGSRTYAITSQGLQINNDQAAVGFVKQTFETALDASKTYTLTIEFSDNHKETVTGDLNALLYTEYYSGISLQCTDTYVQLRIQASMGATVACVKVETGNISTLANDVAPNQTLETIKCQEADFRSVSDIMATGSTNTTGAQIDAGSFFYLNGQFCKALTNIAVNATFTENTNYKKDTVGEELKKWTLVATATGDGVKTWSQVISEISSPYPATEPYKYLIVLNDVLCFHPMGRYSFVLIDGADTSYGSAYIRVINMQTGGFYEALGTLTFTNYSTGVFPSGYTLKLYKTS